MSAKNYWYPVAFVGITLLWLLSALWNFSHSVVLAGGENPLVLLEGRLPAWSGVAFGIGLASVGADTVKAVAGFLMISCLFNKALNWPMRLGAVFIAALLCIPTFAWSCRSAVGMASMAFGDTIAGRGNEIAAAKSLASQIEYDQGRLKWLNEQTSTKLSARMATRQEADALRRELARNRAELRSGRGIGAADPGGQVIAATLGIPVEAVSRWSVILFIAMVELASTLGYPVLALATAVAKPKELQPDRPKVFQIQTNAISENFSSGKPLKSNESYERSESTIPTNTFIPARTAFERLQKDMGNGAQNGHTTNVVEEPKTEKRKPSGRPKNAHRDDGHMEAYVDLCHARNEKPRRKSYVRYCRDEHIGPLNSNDYHYKLKLLRNRHLPRKTVARYFDVPKGFGEMNGSVAH